MSVGKVGSAYRYFFGVRTGGGAARTGLVTANFTITVRNPGNTATLAAPTVTEVGGGMYFFDIAGAFTTTHGAGQYGTEVAVILAPLDLFVDIVDFFVSTFDDLATAVALAAVQADTDDIQTRLPAALVAGRMDSDVAVIQPGAIDAAAIATDAIDADALAADAVAEIQASILSDATPFAGANIDATISSRSDFDEATDPVELLDAGGAAGTSAAELVVDVDAAITASHGVGSYVGGAVVSSQVTEIWQRLGLDLANEAVHITATESVDGSVRIPANGAVINLLVEKTGATVTVTRQ